MATFLGSISMNHSAFVKRLKAEMQRIGINARELAERADVGRSFVYDILNEKSMNPTSKKLSAIANVLGVSVPYLLNGTRYENSRGFAEDSAFADSPLASSKEQDELVAVTSIKVEASLGGGTVINDEIQGKPYYFHRSWIRNHLQVRPNDLRIIFVRGDSMHPTLTDNDMVLVDVTKKAPSPSGIFVLFDGMGLMVKRLEYIPGMGMETARVRIISDNTTYGNYERNLEEINIVGKVVWFARELK